MQRRSVLTLGALSPLVALPASAQPEATHRFFADFETADQAARDLSQKLRGCMYMEILFEKDGVPYRGWAIRHEDGGFSSCSGVVPDLMQRSRGDLKSAVESLTHLHTVWCQKEVDPDFILVCNYQWGICPIENPHPACPTETIKGTLNVWNALVASGQRESGNQEQFDHLVRQCGLIFDPICS